MNYFINTLGVISGGSIGLVVGFALPLCVTYVIRYVTGYDLGVQLAGFYAILTIPLCLIAGARYGLFLSKIINNPEHGWQYFLHGFLGWAGILFILLGIFSIIYIPIFVHRI